MQGANYEAIYLTKEALCSQFQAQLKGPGPGTPLCSSQDEPWGVPWGLRSPRGIVQGEELPKAPPAALKPGQNREFIPSVR